MRKEVVSGLFLCCV